ncbi:hypothetical protein RvY_08197 [Ramazzottius varieornatus]|uniref:Dynein light chain n=1 Tax=Ramazzottius varieornatus TaxID=947166 RepID=A0A1D1V7C5_RAMVA|nr:hypothetical protein RvY_08197 [Ramazzottius varieornatus]
MADNQEDGGAKDGGVAPLADEGQEEVKEEDLVPIYPLVVQCDINPEWSEDVVDKVNNYFEKHATNYEVFAKTIKLYMDDKYAVEGKWNVIVGDSFSLDMFCNKVLGDFCFVHLD